MLVPPVPDPALFALLARAGGPPQPKEVWPEEPIWFNASSGQDLLRANLTEYMAMEHVQGVLTGVRRLSSGEPFPANAVTVAGRDTSNNSSVEAIRNTGGPDVINVAELLALPGADQKTYIGRYDSEWRAASPEYDTREARLAELLRSGDVFASPRLFDNARTKTRQNYGNKGVKTLCVALDATTASMIEAATSSSDYIWILPTAPEEVWQRIGSSSAQAVVHASSVQDLTTARQRAQQFGVSIAAWVTATPENLKQVLPAG